MKSSLFIVFSIGIMALVACSGKKSEGDSQFFTLTKTELQNKIKGAWAAQTIGVTYGGPTEFKYLKRMIPDSVEIVWTDTTLNHWMTRVPGLYDDVYMDLTFVEVMEREGINAPAASHAKAYAEAGYWLWHANQQGRYNVLNGMSPPESGHWMNNPHADDIDFQIEADFAGIMAPGMPNTALEICDRVGHIMNYGDGYYGGVFVAGMYTFAFVESDIPTIVSKGLSLVPTESTFYQCIADVIKWHQEYPTDWKKNWELTEAKWGEDIGCPDGAFEDFNIDAKLNSAYVVLGLLYGEGDFTKTLEISTRAGQDSDCNPATAAAILGTVYGYDAIPEFWKQGLSGIENMDFKFTSTSLNEAYDISYKHALQLIAENGGEVTENEVKIKLQSPVAAPLEQSFPGYQLNTEQDINQKIGFKDAQTKTFEFEGVGVVLNGRARHVDFDNAYALETPEQTLDDYVLLVDFKIDGELKKQMKLPLKFITRAHELFFQYELPPGKHTLELTINNPNEKVYLDLQKIFTYTKSAE